MTELGIDRRMEEVSLQLVYLQRKQNKYREKNGTTNRSLDKSIKQKFDQMDDLYCKKRTLHK